MADETISDEKVYHGVRSEDTWLTKEPITLPQAEDLIMKHLRGANLDKNYWIEEEGDHLVMSFTDRDQPESSSSPGSNDFAKDGIWSTPGKGRTDKRTGGH